MFVSAYLFSISVTVSKACDISRAIVRGSVGRSVFWLNVVVILGRLVSW